MKQKTRRGSSAFTLIEIVVVVLIVGLLGAMLLPAPSRPGRGGARRIGCINNLKEIGTAYRIWAGDNGDLVPYQQTVASNGWRDFLTNANQGEICWTNYVIMQDELGQSPKLLICPSDERTAFMGAFSKLNDNFHVSYFVGVSANDEQPQSIQGGDRNLGPGTKPDPDYGYSRLYGLGNDVAIPITGPVSWSLKMHSGSNYPMGAGNILLGDGSGQQTTTATFNQTWLRNADPTTNWPAGHIPATPSIRLVFP